MKTIIKKPSRNDYTITQFTKNNFGLVKILNTYNSYDKALEDLFKLNSKDISEDELLNKFVKQK